MTEIAVWIVGFVAIIVVAVVAAVLLGLRDSSPQGNPGPERVAQLENGLRPKPPFEVARSEYTGVMNQMAGQIAALVPGMTWHADENSWRGCGGDYVWTRAVQVFYRIVFDRAIPDGVWPQAIQVVKDGAARFGATTVDVFVDQPDSKDLAISNPDGAQFHFGTKVQTILSAKSDCRMRAADTPTPTSTGHP
jgi:hypothetical protein